MSGSSGPGSSVPGSASSGGDEVPAASTESRGFGRYAELTRRVGRRYTALIFLARLPMAMTVFGTITFVAAARGSIADAGLVSAALALTTALAQPLVGRWTQAAGQRVPLLVLTPISVAAILGMVAAGRAHAPLWVLMLIAVVMGATNLPIGGLSRVRWSAAVRSQRESHAAMSLESVGEEVTFVLGPAVVGVLAVAVGPGFALIVDAVAQLLLVPLFALHPLSPRATAIPFGAETMSLPRALSHVWAPVLAMVMVGVYFGSVQTTDSALAADLGHPSAGGLIYALLGLGSAISALGSVLLPDSLTLRTRLILSGFGMGGVAALATFVGFLDAPLGLVLLLLAMLSGGLFVGIALVTVYALVGDQAPPAGAAVAMTATGAAIVLGVAVGTSLGGRVAESLGSSLGFLVAAGACVALVLLGALPRHSSSPAAGSQVG